MYKYLARRIKSDEQVVILTDKLWVWYQTPSVKLHFPFSGHKSVNHGNIAQILRNESGFLNRTPYSKLSSLRLVSVQRLHKTAFTIQTSGPDRLGLFSTLQHFKPDIPWLPSPQFLWTTRMTNEISHDTV